MSEASINCKRFPIFEVLAKRLAERKIFAGAKIGWHCHLTELTAPAIQPLMAAGAEVFLSECNSQTTSSNAVEQMRNFGAQVYLGKDSCSQVLSHQPNVLSDTGFDLIAKYLASDKDFALGACEITTSGINRLREQKDVPLPVVNINSGQLKSRIENFHGVGDGLVEALPLLLAEKNWQGKVVTVCGYGQVGSGCALYLQKLGAKIQIVESDPIKQLIAHYDGYKITSMESALASSELFVSATGANKLLGKESFQYLRPGILLVNVGHFAEEIDVEALKQSANSHRALSQHVDEYSVGVENKPILLACQGHPVNVVLLTGSIEPTLIHLTTEILCLEALISTNSNRGKLANGENPIPPSVEREASLTALEALKLARSKMSRH
jgi:adenosylhomocysteinase